MPLTVRNNGSSPTNVIKAAWFNDFYNLLTGIMVDQPVTIGNNITLGPPLNYPNPGPTVAPGGSLTASTAMSIGAYKYVYTFFSNSANLGLDLLGGESSVSPTFSITTTTGNQAVNLTGIATGPAGTVGRNIYRVKVGTTSPFFLLTTLNDNVTTTFADTTPDGGLSTVVSPPFSSFGGALAIYGFNPTNPLVSGFYSDGTMSIQGTPQGANGSVAGTATFLTPIWGTSLKIAMITFGGHKSASTPSFTLPSTIGRALGLNMSNNTSNVAIRTGGTTNNIASLNALLAGGGGTFATAGAWGSGAIGYIGTTSDNLLIGSTGGTVVNGAFVLVGA